MVTGFVSVGFGAVVEFDDGSFGLSGDVVGSTVLSGFLAADGSSRRRSTGSSCRSLRSLLVGEPEL